MRLRRELILAFDDAHRLLDALLEVAVLALELALDDRRPADVRMQLVVAGEIRLRLGPGYFQCTRSLDRVPFLLGDNGEQVLDPDRLGARDVLDRILVDLDRNRARDGGPNHAR